MPDKSKNVFSKMTIDLGHHRSVWMIS